MSYQPPPEQVPGPVVSGTSPTWTPAPPMQEKPGRTSPALLQFPRRVLFLLIALFLASFVIFLLVRGAGGSRALVGPQVSPAEMEQLRQQLGLDQPLWAQYFRWLGNAFRGDLGTSFATRQPVRDMLGRYLPNTLLLLAAALGLALLLALLGALVALLVHKLEDWAGPVGSVLKGLGRLLAFLPAAMPALCLGILLIWLFFIQWRVLPAVGMFDPRVGPGDLAGRLRHLVLPVVTLALYPALLTGQAVAREVTLPRERAGGRLLLVGLLKALGTLLGQIGGLLSAIVVVEVLFAWPGIGRLAFDALARADFPVVSGLLLTFALLVLAGRLVAELFRWLERLVREPLSAPLPQTGRWRKSARTVYLLAALSLLLAPLGLAIAGLTADPGAFVRTDPLARLDPPSPRHPWGTDKQGRDLQQMALRGALAWLGMAGLVAVALLLPAGLWGALTGFLSSLRTFWMESLADLLLLPADALLLIPAVPGAIVTVILLYPRFEGPLAGWIAVGGAAALFLLPRAIRVYPTLWPAAPGGRRGLLLGLAGPAALLLGSYFAALALIVSVDFLGLGVRPPVLTLGSVMEGAVNYSTSAPHLLLVPGILLAACAFALYTAADAVVGFFHTKQAMARLNE